MDMPTIKHDDLSVGQRVLYRYEKASGKPYGPYKIKLKSRDHTGAYVILTDTKGADTKVSLAEDEDYGQPVFFKTT